MSEQDRAAQRREAMRKKTLSVMEIILDTALESVDECLIYCNETIEDTALSDLLRAAKFHIQQAEKRRSEL